MSAKIQEQKHELRTHCVSVRITPSELKKLDSMRGGISRGSYIRNIFLGKKIPPQVPEVNQKAYIETARWASNLNQIARFLNAYDGDEIPSQGVREIYAYLKKFRAKLIGLDFSETSGDDEKDEA